MPYDSPMMRQYASIKEQYTDCMLFFRLGDFYEMFADDAIVAARELELTLTTRDRTAENPEDRVPMCGVPYHSSEAYIQRLIARGYKVALCEQLEDPSQTKTLVERGVVKVVTPGTVTEPMMLDDGKPNYLAAVYIGEDDAAVARADISTGEAVVTAITPYSAARLRGELAAASPSEILLGGIAIEDAELREYIMQTLNITPQPSTERFGEDKTREILSRNADEYVRTLDGAAGSAVGALLSYLEETQKTVLPQIRFKGVTSGEYMELDGAAIRGLELVASNKTGEKRGSLLWALDKTRTPMGRRLLRAWILRPLLSPARIVRRLDAVEELTRENVTRGEIMHGLRNVGDVERLCGKAAYGNANARDLLALARSFEAVDEIVPFAEKLSGAEMREIASLDRLSDLCGEILAAIADEPSVNARDGGIIRSGFDAEVDRLRALVEDGSGAMAHLEARERERTGIRLKVGYTRAFGYYIEVPRSRSDAVPPEYFRRQTLTNAERYVTEELKQLEAELNSARERLSELEYAIFTRIIQRVAESSRRIAETAALIAKLDALCSLAEAASKNDYIKPEINDGEVIDIRNGRHPVVELTRTDTHFVPNDTYLDNNSNLAAIITGPNMAGKSTYMRQTALIVLMAQIGSFVPAKSANIGIVDRVFTRIGASDDLAAGKSTFLVEMSESAEILESATSRSLIVFDEIGRGTSTYDGVAIARAILEYCADKRRLGAKTLFSTHYHELAEAERDNPRIKCYEITARRRGDEVIFLRKITPGAAADSYGIDVARLAGLPESVIKRAKTVMRELSDSERVQAPVTSDILLDAQMSFGDAKAIAAAERLRRVNLNAISPLEALNLLYEIQREVSPV